MHLLKFFRTTHRWIGLVLSIVFLCTASTGFLLLIKKRSDWIQPPTQTGAAGAPADFISIEQLFDIVRAQNHPDFASVQDIERVDLRPSERVFKVQSEHNHAEIQVCAVTGAVLSVAWRPSDLLESLHDGSFVAGWFHDWVMPAASVGLLFLLLSGWWLWLAPKLRKRRTRPNPSPKR